jgi:cellulose synthase/poly-beta-1,6-N-acetylglucosamine synthase-like glycosyltransferase
LTCLYFIDLFFNLFLIINSMKKDPAIRIRDEEIDEISDWPRYTIMCPLYKEWEVVDQFVEAISALDYPKDKLQVILSLEEVDKKTVEEISRMKLPPYFEILITPDTQPRTKPKACNYALMHTTGEYVVIYDAEDIPDPLQLKKAVAAFRRLEGKNVVCLQAKLNFYNPNQNLLTRMFTLEYSLWFDLVLTGLHSINAPIPLGGTSNHFKKASLDILQGWDPFNVTEDCDLGIRLFKNGYKTNVLDSITMEEANSDFFGWFKQRSRWIKGYIQTYLVHMRRPHEFITDWSNPHILTFQIIVGFKFMSMWINPLLWIMTISYFALRHVVGPYIESLYITPILYIGMFSLVAGNFLYFYYNMIGAGMRKQWDLVKYAFFSPVYWLMMSYASVKALQSIIFAPHYWEKTTHGLHKRKPVVA